MVPDLHMKELHNILLGMVEKSVSDVKGGGW